MSAELRAALYHAYNPAAVRTRLLRRTAAWRVALPALRELALITTSVLVALAANAWWQDRADRRRERLYLQQLLRDLGETDARLRGSITGDSLHLLRTVRFLDAVAEATAPAAPPDSVFGWTGAAYSAFAPVGGTYTALVQNGGIELLRNDGLRLRLIDYASVVAAAQEVLRRTEDQTWRDAEQAALAYRRLRLPRAPRAAGGQEGAARAAAALRDPQLVAAMDAQRLVSENRLAELRALRAPTAALRRLLEANSRREGGRRRPRRRARTRQGLGPAPRDDARMTSA